MTAFYKLQFYKNAFVKFTLVKSASYKLVALKKALVRLASGILILLKSQWRKDIWELFSIVMEFDAAYVI